MGKNGGQPQDTILTLEEALKRFARKRLENAETRNAAAPASAQGSKVHYPDFSASLKREEDVGIGREHPPGDTAVDAPAAVEAANASSESLGDIVAVIDGVPRTLEDLERLAAADKAFHEDFPESPDEPFPGEETVEPFVRNTSRRDFALGAMGAALLVWVAILVTRVPIVNEPRIFAKAVPTPALKASSIKSAQELIATWVIIPDSETALASNGRVHFLHPDVHPAQGPAYFGVATAWAPEVWGAKVQAVFIGSPADKAGLQPGDVISEFDGKTVRDAKALNDLIEQYSPGQRVEFRVWHSGQPMYLVARLGEMTTVASR